MALLGRSRLERLRCERSINLTMVPEITMGHQITMRPEITRDHAITKRGGITRRDEITMRRETMVGRALTTTTILVIRHGMVAPRGGRFKVETAHPTKVQLVEVGTRGTAARQITRYRAASVSRILDRANQVSSGSLAMFTAILRASSRVRLLRPSVPSARHD